MNMQKEFNDTGPCIPARHYAVTYQNQEDFISVFLKMLIKEFEFLNVPDITGFTSSVFTHT
jgi:hypothetical protein